MFPSAVSPLWSGFRIKRKRRGGKEKLEEGREKKEKERSVRPIKLLIIFPLTVETKVMAQKTRKKKKKKGTGKGRKGRRKNPKTAPASYS